MKNDKFKIYFLNFVFLAFLIFALFESKVITKTILAIVITAYAVLVKVLLKKRKIISIYNKQVILLNVGFSILYLTVFYLSGFYFGFYDSPVKLTLWGIITFILPITVIVISSEIIRYIFISQKTKVNGVLTFISMVLIDVKLYIGIYDATRLDEFLVIIGFIIFASISSNLLYNYISLRFGYKPIIVYRLITSLYSYIIPIIPDVIVFFRSIGRMIYPYIMYMTLEYTYSKSKTASSFSKRKGRIIATTITAVFMLLLTMLISCKFTYGILVVGSDSMTGALNKGDAIVFKSYDNQVIGVNDIIIFNKNNSQIIHRVMKKEVFNDEYRYYTKGDYNADMDNWFVKKSDIVGISKFRIKYVGFPTLWVNDVFDKKK